MALPILWYEFEKENKKKYVSIQKMAFLKWIENELKKIEIKMKVRNEFLLNL